MVKKESYVTCKELQLTVEPLKEDLREIKNNHLPHFQKQLESMAARIWIIMVALIVLSVLVGIDIIKFFVGGL